MSIKGPFHHVHLVSEDPQGTVGWYVENLGGRIFDERNVRGSMRYRLRLGDAQINIRAPRPGETIVPHGVGKTVGIDHFGLSTDRLEPLLHQLQSRGVKILEPIFATPAGGARFLYRGPRRCRDRNHGNIIVATRPLWVESGHRARRDSLTAGVRWETSPHHE